MSIKILKRRLNRVTPLITMRRAVLEQETVILISLRVEMEDLLGQINTYKKLYHHAIELLNDARENDQRGQSHVLDQRITHCREGWSKGLEEVKIKKKMIIEQSEKVASSQARVKATESMKEKIQIKINAEMERLSTIQCDETSQSSYMRR